MNKLLWPIIVRTIIAVFGVLLAVFLYIAWRGNQQGSIILYAIPLIPAVVNFLFIFKLSRIFKLNQNVFFRKYLLYNGIKFLLNLFLFITLIFVYRSNPIPIIVVYLLSFIIFFILEIIEIQILIRKMR